jgi:flagellar biosynthesis protein FliQ
MGVAESLDLGREALLMVLVLAAPIMGVGLLVGLTVSMFQAMTQIQEQTLSFVPKIIAMMGTALLLVPWLASRVVEYARELFGTVPF